MPAKFAAVSPERRDEILQYLCGIFGIKELPANLIPQTLDWKYFAPHPWWPSSRSYVIETDAGIAAHGCATPLRFKFGGAAVDSMVIIDWASGKLIPGAGVLIWRRCAEAANGSLLAIGGSTEALNVISRLKWFAPKRDLRWYARPLRPTTRFLRSPRSLRDWLKLGRNILWSMSPSLPQTKGWTCRLARPEDPVFTPEGDFVPISRTRPWIDYLGACPIANCKLWILERDREPRGHALVANLEGSARIADFALGGTQDEAAIAYAFSALVRTLKSQKDFLEVVAASSLTEYCQAYERCGLRYRGVSAVRLADSQKVLPQDSRLEINPALGDAFYLYDPSNPFYL